ncbi:anti-sigma factor [Rubellimicrobium rubrum]|uniref:Anti-sigma factor n=1 Tax=Rubellimicrobium rubrum TaxID=2585369 RepID=A0A5C4N3G5_9RHOB|nr:anti-sigma factor [Rubellimicrobium rubrum]TNC51967.1 anti-sigma factor [Rubellimicrobium rubrum]
MTPDPDDDLQADLYVLGLLDPAEQAQAEQRIESDQAFAVLVAAAARRLAPIDDTAEPVPLPDGAWERLERRLASPVELAAPPLRPADRPAANLNRSVWRMVLGVAAALLLTLGLAWPFLTGLPSSRTEPAAIAVLLDPEGAPFALIEDFGGGEVTVTTLASYEVPAGESLQVWTKWSEEVGPVSLGVLDEFTGAPVGAEGLPQPIAGQLYEITLEEEGGSVTGRPTGPILGVGRASIPG